MPYVPAHTSAPGNHDLLGSPGTLRYFNQNRTPTFTSTYGAPVIAKASRSALRMGTYTLNGMFRVPTAYDRSAQMTTDLSGGFDYWDGWEYLVANDSRIFHGIKPLTGPRGGFAAPVAVSHSLRERAEAEALLKVQDMKIDLGVFFGELLKTATMMANRLKTLLYAWNAVRHGNWALAVKHLLGTTTGGYSGGQAAANMWLELQYGWRPLLSDLWGGYELLRQGFRDQQVLFSVTRTITQPLDPVGFWEASPREILTEGEATESCRVKLWGRVTGDLFIASNLGLINPLSIAWELTTFSFVLDWLVPIGAMLQSLTATMGVTFVAGVRTETKYADVTGTRIRYPNSSRSLSGKLPKVRNRVFAMSRYTYNSWPWVLPYIRNPFSTDHLTSAVALLSQTRR